MQTLSGVDYFIANSKNVAARIQKTYGRRSVIINPPVETNLFQPAPVDGDYFLVVSRLNAYKRLDVVIEAFNQLDLPLKIIGTGPEQRHLQGLAKANIEFLGQVSDQALVEFLAQCQALIFPGEEDFGIVPLEAMSCGRPVIAYKAGGAKETVIEGQTGLFFEEQSPRALVEVIKEFQFATFNKAEIRSQALNFDQLSFERKIKAFVKEKYDEYFG